MGAINLASVKRACALLVFLTVSFLWVVVAFAVPAASEPVIFTQPDGRQISVTVRGDEFFSWAENEHGDVIVFNDDDFSWRYADIENGQIMSTPSFVGDVRPFMAPYERTTRASLANLIAQAERFDHTVLDPRLEDPSMQMALNQRVLLLLIEFNDVRMQGSDQHHHGTYFDTTPGAVSVVNFWRDMSGGHNVFMPAQTTTTITQQFTRTVTVPSNITVASIPWANNGVDVTVFPSTQQGVVRVRLNINHPVRTWNTTANNSSHTRAMVLAALRAIHEQPNATFSFAPFDNLHVYAIVAGGEASGGANPGGGQTWGHAWSFNRWAFGSTGTQRYATHGERDTNGFMGIGVAVHELGHTLGLPDLYDYTSMSDGLGPFCLMAGGSWGALTGGPRGHFPVGLSAYALVQLGYVTPTVINAGQNWTGAVHSINSTTGNRNILRINSPTNSQQYFLIENRQATSGWDRGMQRSGITAANNNNGGILIYHVDTSMVNQGTFRINDNWRRKRVDLEEASGVNFLDTRSWPGGHDAFFRSGNNYRFGPATTPNSNFYQLRQFPNNPASEQGIQNVVTGINVEVLSARAYSMQVVLGVNPVSWAVSPTSITFPSVPSGYGTQPALPATINNTGTVALTGVSASLTSGATSFVITQHPASSIPAGGNATVSVRPANGLQAGTHTGNLRINTANGGTRDVTLSFTVSAGALTLTRTAPNATVNVLAGVNGRVPVTITAPANGGVIIRGTAGNSTDSDPALFSGQGAGATRIAFQNFNNWNFTYTIPAGQTRTVFAGTGGNIARNYQITSIWPEEGTGHQLSVTATTATSITVSSGLTTRWYRLMDASGTSFVRDWQQNNGVFTGLTAGTAYQARLWITSEQLPGLNVITSPAQPVGNRLGNVVTVNTITAPSGWTVQYSIRTGTTGTWGAWQTSNQFSVLASQTSHQVRARFLATNTATHAHSFESVPSVSIVESHQLFVTATTATSITVSSGLTNRWYRLMDASGTVTVRTWQQNDGLFTGLTAGTAYQARLWTTSEQLPGLNVITSPAQPVGSRLGNVVTVNTITAPSGWTVQYSIRTGTTGTWGAWQTSNQFSVLASQTSHQVRARFLATNNATHAHSFESVPSESIVVGSAPVITSHPANSTVNAGQTATFTAVVTGQPAPALQWQRSTDTGISWVNVTNVGGYSGATTATLTRTNVTAALNGNMYRIIASNGFAPNAISNPAVLTVQFAPAITVQPISQIVTEGQSVTFVSGATGNPAPSFQWQRSENNGVTWTNVTNGGGYSGATTATLTRTNTTPSMNGNRYRAVATNSVSSATSSTADLVVDTIIDLTLESPSALINVRHGVYGRVPVRVTAPEHGGVILSGQGGQSNANDPALFDGRGAQAERIAFQNSNFNFIYTVPAGQTRIVYVGTGGNVARTYTVTAAWPEAAPVITPQPANQTVTVGQTATFTSGATGHPAPVFQWQFSSNWGGSWTNIVGATSAELTLQNVTLEMNNFNYRLVATNSAGQTFSYPAILTVNPLAAVVNTVTAAPVTHPQSGGNSAVTVTGGNLIPENMLIAAFLNNTSQAMYVQVPEGSANNVTANITFPANTGSTNRVYSIRVSVDGGSTFLTDPAATVTVESSSPQIIEQPANRTVTAGQTATFNVIATGVTSFQWQRSANLGETWSDISNSAVYSGANTGTLTVTNTTASMDTNFYRVVVSSDTVSVTSDWAELSVLTTAGQVNLSLPENLFTAVGSTVSVPVMLEGNPGIAAVSFNVNFDTNYLSLLENEWTVGNILAISAAPYDVSSSPVFFDFISSNYLNVNANGTLITIDFLVTGAPPSGSTQITLSEPRAFNDGPREVDVIAQAGEITVGAFLYGDVNDSGSVSSGDLLILRQYLAKHPVAEPGGPLSNIAAADVFRDGQLDARDNLVLSQYLAWMRVNLPTIPSQMVSAFGAPALPLELSFGDTVFTDGEYVDVTILLNENPGFWNLEFTLNYGSSLMSLVSVTNNMSEVALIRGIAEHGSALLIFTAHDVMNDFSGNGELVTLRFRITDTERNAPPYVEISGASAINVGFADVAVMSFDTEIDFAVNQAEVYVGEGEPTE